MNEVLKCRVHESGGGRDKYSEEVVAFKSLALYVESRVSWELVRVKRERIPLPCAFPAP